MKKTLTVLAATTALSAAIGVAGWSATDAAHAIPTMPFAAVLELDQDATQLVLASDEDDDDREYRPGSRSEEDDDDDEDCDDEDGEDDDDGDNCGGTAGNAAPAGTVAPPQNGLFGSGTPPIVQMN